MGAYARGRDTEDRAGGRTGRGPQWGAGLGAGVGATTESWGKGGWRSSGGGPAPGSTGPEWG